jgi:CxxC motif-containing protein (DUF1111 family)
MNTVKIARAHALAGLASMLLGSVAWPTDALSQNNSTARATDADASSNAATANATAGQRSFGNNFGRSPSRGGGTDPGVRGGTPGAGGPLQGLSNAELQFFNASKEVFQEVDAVPDGLGPRFNLDSCSGCHSFPSIGGSSPPNNNPQVGVATAAGAKNVVPSFITANGPIREARFVRNPDGSPDGSVHALFVITGRSDAPGCNIQQPDFAAQLARNNVVFRIPTPLFGLGLVENVPDSALQSSLAANAHQKRALGISGRFNINGNDTTIARFGWKAQNKSLLLFSGEAYNVEIGVTNDLFPNEREGDPNCQFNATPESAMPLEPENTVSPAANFQSDIELFSAFMRLTAPPTPATSSATPVAQTTGSTSSSSTTSTLMGSATADASGVMTTAAGSPTAESSATSTATITRGSQVFTNIGCQACHTKSYTTAKSPTTGQSNVTFQPYSDFAVHNMGNGLADGVTQGGANGNEFRTAPLWGVGQRVFFLHDGRTNDLNVAIQQHASPGSEANAVISNYNMLSRDDQQSVLNFLRSL